jgi:integrase
MYRRTTFQPPKKITQAWIDKVVLPEDIGPVKGDAIWVSDREKPGLYVVLRKSGVHSYGFKATVPCLGKPDPFIIARTQCVSLQYARQFTQKCYEVLNQGKNPRFVVKGVAQTKKIRKVMDVFEDYLASKEKTLSKYTVRNYRTSFNRHMPEQLKNNSLSSLTRVEIENCVNNIKHVHDANGFIHTLCAFFNWCLRKKLNLPEGNVTQHIELRVVPKNKQKQKYGMMSSTQEELFNKTLLELMAISRGKQGQRRLYQGVIMVQLLYWLGCRPCELFLIKKNQIYKSAEDQWFIDLNGKGMNRTIPLFVPASLREEIISLAASKLDDSILWSWTSDTTAKKVLARTWHKYILPLYHQKLQEQGLPEANQLKIPYDLRHHSQTHWYFKDDSPDRCARWHGNSVKVAQQYYVNITPEQQAKRWASVKWVNQEKLSVNDSPPKESKVHQGSVWVLNASQPHSTFMVNQPHFFSPKMKSKECASGWALITQIGFGIV